VAGAFAAVIENGNIAETVKKLAEKAGIEVDL
jgi:hypothetical protein